MTACLLCRNASTRNGASGLTQEAALFPDSFRKSDFFKLRRIIREKIFASWRDLQLRLIIECMHLSCSICIFKCLLNINLAAANVARVFPHKCLPQTQTMSLFEENESKEQITAEQPSSRRTKLFPWDSVASQLFEPYGESALDQLSLQDVWTAANKGNKKALYHSHLCASQASDAWHVGAGISLTAASLLAAIKNFRQPDMKRLIVPTVYEKIEKELEDLEPALVLLNLGKGSQSNRDTGSFRAAKRHKAAAGGSDGMTGSEEQTLEAAKKFYQWLAQEKTPFRSLLFLLSGNNSYYSAHCAEVVARAGLKHKPITQADFVNAMQARMQKMPQPQAHGGSAGSDATGLFDI